MSKLYSTIHSFSQTILRAAACLIALVIFTAAASAATYTVDTTADNATFTTCPMAAAGDCSLRGAIARANASTTEADTITFALPANSTITLTGGDLNILNGAALTITNQAGASNLVISGGGVSRIFDVYPLANLTLNSVTVTQGRANNGGGILNYGTLSLMNSTVSGNTVNTSFYGGGIYNNRGTTTLTNSTVRGNSAAYGGGIYNDEGTINLTSVTVAFNSANSFGGGVYTISGRLYTATVNLRNTIVANNTAGSYAPDVHGAIAPASSFNLIGNGGYMTGITNGTGGNQVGVDPRLDPALAFNGGTTPNHALLPGSPAIDKGSATGTDQRGFTRPVDLPDYANATATGANGADIGAFEAQTSPTAPPRTVDTTVDNAALTACTAAANDCSLRGAINKANGADVADTIDFAIPATDPNCPGGVCTITLIGGELGINNAATAGTLTIINSTGASNLLISGGNASRIFSVNTGANLTLGGVTITMGTGLGAGINNSGTLTLLNSTVSGNTSVTNGGGIYNSSGGTTTLTNSTVSGNRAQFGGGIYNVNTGTLSLTNSTVSGNTGTNSVGGIFNDFGATATLLNSTVSGNTAPDSAGIFNNGRLNLTSVTVAFNNGGGITSNFGSGREANLRNTIVAQNTRTNFNGAVSPTSSFNLIGTLSNPIDPLLAPLALNGGTTLNHALLPDSPAIDKGSATGTDQRGLTRPVDNPSIANATGGNGADIGAFEVQVTTAATVTVSGRVTARGRGISNAIVHLTSQSGEILTVRTSRGGYYTFTNLEAGETYIFNVFSKRYQFDPKVINLTEDLSEVDFTAQ